MPFLLMVLVWCVFETTRFKLLLTAPLLAFGLPKPYRRVWVLVVGLSLALMPSRQNPLLFLGPSGKRVEQPWLLSFTNLVPEIELARVSTLLAPIFPFPASGRLLREVRAIAPFDNAVIREYRTLQARGLEDAAPSLLPLQAVQQLGALRDVHAFTMHLPERRERPVPVVIFLHGYLGHFQLYESFWSEEREVAVLIPSTQNLMGLWSEADLAFVLGPALDALSEHVPVDRTQLHLVGLSNGGSGVNRALQTRAQQFRSMTWLSTYIEETHGPWPKTLAIVSGANDGIAKNNLEAAARLRAQGAHVKVTRFENEGHLVMLTRREEVLTALRAAR